MGVACNLLTAVGGAPQVLRPNLPTSTRAYGASFDLGLMPFSIETLEQFIAIEQPDLPEAGNGAGPTRQLPSTTQPKLSDIFSSESDYDTHVCTVALRTALNIWRRNTVKPSSLSDRQRPRPPPASLALSRN